tara:strand:+ start:252 stop:980 length:729 start_codon:yes stop_codon:yes gene_type:complete
MAVTHKGLIQSSAIAKELGKSYESRVLADLAGNLEKWGELSGRQTAYAESLMSKYNEEKLAETKQRIHTISHGWSREDEELLKWLRFVCFFFKSANCRRYEHHVHRLRPHAERLARSLDLLEERGYKACPIDDITPLLDSKLIDTLRATYTATPKHTIGDLVSIRGRGKYFGAWTTKHGSREGRFIRESFQICIITEVVNGTFRCKNVHPTKGSSRLYRLKAFASGQSTEILIEEDLIKPMK